MKRCMGLLILTALLCLLCAGTEEADFSAAIAHADAVNLTGSENTLPDDIERIESQAFTGAGLERVLLPRSLKYIADDAFDANVRFIVYADSYAASWAPFDRIDEVIGGEPEDWHDVLTWVTEPEEDPQIAVITGYLGDQETVYLPDTLDGVPVCRIADEAFLGKPITHIRFPAQLQDIGNQAFGGCTQLLEVRIPDSVTVIGGGAFDGCTALRRVVLPALVENVSVPIFKNCVALKEVTMSVALQGNGTEVFMNCPNVETIHYLSGSTGIFNLKVGNSPSCLEYQSKRSLMTVDFGEGITVIGDSAFAYPRYEYENDCFVLAALRLPSTLKTIGTAAFYGLRYLTDVTLPAGLEILDSEAFAWCSSLVPPDVPASTVQGQNVFYGCIGMEGSDEGGSEGE